MSGTDERKNSSSSSSSSSNNEGKTRMPRSPRSPQSARRTDSYRAVPASELAEWARQAGDIPLATFSPSRARRFAQQKQARLYRIATLLQQGRLRANLSLRAVETLADQDGVSVDHTRIRRMEHLHELEYVKEINEEALGWLLNLYGYSLSDMEIPANRAYGDDVTQLLAVFSALPTDLRQKMIEFGRFQLSLLGIRTGQRGHTFGARAKPGEPEEPEETYEERQQRQSPASNVTRLADKRQQQIDPVAAAQAEEEEAAVRALRGEDVDAYLDAALDAPAARARDAIREQARRDEAAAAARGARQKQRRVSNGPSSSTPPAASAAHTSTPAEDDHS